MASSTTTLSLRPDRKLLDPHFEGYKLSLESLPTYHHTINPAIRQAEQSDFQFSLQHFRIFGLQNRLYSDPWYKNYLYYVSEGQYIKQVKFNDFGFEESHVVLHIPKECQLAGEYNESIHFTSPHQLIVSDGRGNLFLVMTDDRSSSQQWMIVSTIEIEQDKKPFVVIYSRLTNELEIECLLLNAEDAKDVALRNIDDKKNPFLTVLTWITLTTGAEGAWSIKRKRKLAGVGPIDFAALKDDNVLIVSNHQFDFIYDSYKPIEKVTPDEDKSRGKKYSWTQTETIVKINFEATDAIKEGDIQVDITSNNLNITNTDGFTVLRGNLFDNVNPDNSKWIFVDEKLEIQLSKSNVDKNWENLMNEVGNKDHLENLIKDASVGAPLFDSNPPFDPNQLEECDAFPSDFYNLSLYDGETHKIAAQINLSGNQWLFSVILNPDKLPAFCIRHDVDGLIWQPEDGIIFSHVLTLNALGYVQASKQDRKFSTCSEDGSFAVVCDSRRHLYVYHRPNAIGCEVRNRRTGQKIASVARQQVINIDSPDEIIGIHASTQNIFALTNKSLFAIRVRNL